MTANPFWNLFQSKLTEQNMLQGRDKELIFLH